LGLFLTLSPVGRSSPGAVGGRQYVAVVTGGGKLTTNDLVGKDPRLQYLKNVPLGGTLNVFGLFD
jgi:hypothetical protein